MAVKAVKPHREWFRSVTKRTCPCGQRKTNVYSWGEYVVGKWRTVDWFCQSCYQTRVLPRLQRHLDDCGCAFEAVGYRGEVLPPWLTMPTYCPAVKEVA